MFKDFNKTQKEKAMEKEQTKIDRIVNGIIEHIQKHDLDIEYGTNLEDQICFIANWNDFNKLEKFLSSHESYLNIELIWSDTYDYCSDCYRYWGTQPTYYGEESKGIWISDYEIICKDCARDNIEAVIEFYQNQYDKAIPSYLIEDIKNQGFTCMDNEDTESCQIYENGFHHGQNDCPEDIIKNLEKEGYTNRYDYIFAINSIGQFDIHFSLFLEEREI